MAAQPWHPHHLHRATVPLLHREPNGPGVAETATSPQLGRSVAFAFGSVLVLLTAYEVVEARWLGDLGPHRLHSYQHLAGLAAALLAALISAVLVLRGSPSLFDALDSVADQSALAGSDDSTSRDAHFAQWFILMRWLAALVATLLVFLAIAVMDFLPSALWPPLAGAIAALMVLNLAYTHLLRAGVAAAPLLRVQAYGDLAILTTLLHFSGGIENPLTTLMVFHVIIAGIILERRQCYYVASAASALFALLAFGELSGVLQHYTLSIIPHAHEEGIVRHAALDEQYVIARVALHAAVLFLTATFATSIVTQLRRGEEEQRKVEARVQRAQRLAAIGELAGRVAHEVNNPVAIITAKSRLLLSDHAHELTATTASELRKIVELGDRIAGIAQGLLAYCRPSTARAEMQPLAPIARKALAIVAPSARASGVDIRERMTDALAPVRVNAGEMEQVFLNLFLNALDAMPGGGVLSVVGDESVGDHGRRTVRVAVEDTGCGIPDEIQARIFEPFLTTKPEGKGTGLGLSICHGLVTSNGGTIDIDSAPGRGTRVSLWLPAGVA